MAFPQKKRLAAALSQRIALAAVLLMLAACRSEPVQLHTLTPSQPLDTTSVDSSAIKIEAISIPPQVDRQQIVIRQSDSSLVILEDQWWAASLVEELRSALENQLLNNSVRHRVKIRLDVLRFDSVPGRYALIDVSWRLRSQDAEDNVLVECRSTLQTSAGTSIEDITIAHQNNLKELVTEIIETANSEINECPSKRQSY